MTATASASTATPTRVAICEFDRLTPELGVAALVHGEQVALFRLADGAVYAVQNLDPFSGASVMSRGITGSRGDVPTIASPIYKQVFSLIDGTCLVTMDKETHGEMAPDLATYPVEISDGIVYVTLAPEGAS